MAAIWRVMTSLPGAAASIGTDGKSVGLPSNMPVSVGDVSQIWGSVATFEPAATSYGRSLENYIRLQVGVRVLEDILEAEAYKGSISSGQTRG
jgi:hypothetical protein